MNKFLLNHSEKLTGYLLILPAVLIISLFGIFPVFFGMYMSVHKWKVFKGRFLGFENYQRILGDIPAFWLFVLGLLLLILSYGLWSEFKNKVKNKIYLAFLSIAILIIGIILININWEKMLLTGDEDYLYSLIYTFYYSFFTIIFEVGLGLIIAFALYQKLAGKQFFQMILLFPYITPAVMGAAVFFLIFGKAENSFLNQLIGIFGFEPQMWLFDKRPITEVLFGLKIEGLLAGPSLALMSSIIYGIWSYTGYYAIILLAGLSIIPSDFPVGIFTVSPTENLISIFFFHSFFFLIFKISLLDSSLIFNISFADTFLSLDFFFSFFFFSISIILNISDISLLFFPCL